MPMLCQMRLCLDRTQMELCRPSMCMLLLSCWRRAAVRGHVSNTGSSAGAPSPLRGTASRPAPVGLAVQLGEALDVERRTILRAVLGQTAVHIGHPRLQAGPPDQVSLVPHSWTRCRGRSLAEAGFQLKVRHFVCVCSRLWGCALAPWVSRRSCLSLVATGACPNRLRGQPPIQAGPSRELGGAPGWLSVPPGG